METVMVRPCGTCRVMVCTMSMSAPHGKYWTLVNSNMVITWPSSQNVLSENINYTRFSTGTDLGSG